MMEFAVWNCRQLVTVAGTRDLGVIADGAMLVRDERIAAVGTRAEIEALATAATGIVDAGGGIVLPGFVDAHTHPVFAGNRAAEFEMRAQGATYQEIAAAGGGIRSTVRQTREASEAELLHVARRYRQWFVRGGTTTVEAKSGYGLSLEAELKMLRVIAQLDSEGLVRYYPTFLGAHEVPDEYRGRMDDYVTVIVEEMLPRVAREELALACDVFCEPSVFPRDQARRVLMAAKALLPGLRVHADQFTADYGSVLAAECGAMTADHLEHTGEAGMAAMKAAGVMPVLLPASAYTLGAGRYPNARAMLDCGLPVVLATDFNPGSSPTTSMSMVLSLACTQMKMTPAEAIAGATIHAARSLDRETQVGSLEAGKLADFVIHDCEDYRELPYFFGRETAVEVYVGGVNIFKR